MTIKKFAYFPLTNDWIEDLDASAIDISGEDPDYPASKLQNIAMGDTARGESSGSNFIRFDLGEALRPRFFSLINHNFFTGDPVLRSYDDAYITLSGEQATVPFRALDLKFYSKSFHARRYWEWDLSGVTFCDAFFEVGKMIAGTDIVKFGMQISPGIGRGVEWKNIHNITEAEVVWSHRIQENINSLSISWSPSVKEKMLDDVIAFLQATYGGAYPVVLIPDNELPEFYYMRNQDVIRWKEEDARELVNQLSMNFKEDSRGLIQEG